MSKARCPLVKTFAAVIDGVHTDFSITAFEDSFFVVVTQLQKLGTLLRATKDTTLEGATSYSIQTILGKRDDPMIEVCCRQLIETTGAISPKPLVAAIALRKDITPASLRKVVKLFKEQFLASAPASRDEDGEFQPVPAAGTADGPLPPL